MKGSALSDFELFSATKATYNENADTIFSKYSNWDPSNPNENSSWFVSRAVSEAIEEPSDSTWYFKAESKQEGLSSLETERLEEPQNEAEAGEEFYRFLLEDLYREEVSDKELKIQQAPLDVSPFDYLLNSWKKDIAERGDENQKEEAGVTTTEEEPGTLRKLFRLGLKRSPAVKDSSTIVKLEETVETVKPTKVQETRSFSECVRELQDVSFADFGWSRQPSFDSSNIERVFNLTDLEEETKFNKKWHESIKQLRYTAKSITEELHLLDDKVTKRGGDVYDQLWLKTYHDDTESNAATLKEENVELFMHLQPLTSETPYVSPTIQTRRWDVLPAAGVLGRQISRPSPLSIEDAITNPELILREATRSSRYGVTLFHDAWRHLISDTFINFNVHRNRLPSCVQSSQAYYSANVLKFQRVMKYGMTAALYSNVPGILKLFIRLNGLKYIECKVNAIINSSGGFKLFLKNSLSCTAAVHNFDILERVWGNAEDMHEKERQDVCVHFIQCPLTSLAFTLLYNHQWQADLPAAVMLLSSFLRMFTKLLYGGRPKDFLLILNKKKLFNNKNIWDCISSTLRLTTNIAVIDCLLQLISDLSYMTCIDGAPFKKAKVVTLTRALQCFLSTATLPAEGQLRRPQSWDDAYKRSQKLLTFYRNLQTGSLILPDSIYPLTMLPSAASSKHIKWPNHSNYNPCTAVIPCWNPSCNKVFSTLDDAATHTFHACQRCNVVTYCSQECEGFHRQTHQPVCPYMAHPPGYLKFEDPIHHFSFRNIKYLRLQT